LSRLGRAGHYAVALLYPAGNVDIIERVSFPRLLRMIHSLKPILLATDNIFELTNRENLPGFLSKLPSETRVVQVTGAPSSGTNLQALAEKHGLRCPSKRSPVQEAEVSARLAAAGVGVEVAALEDETKILVCRSISLGPGGSSQSRYRRRVHVSILTMTKQIERILNSSGIDFDLSTEESDFGLERSEFTVYVPRTKLAGLVKPGHGNCFQVRIDPVFRTQVDFIPLRPISGAVLETLRSEQKLIVGIDPGTTCGLAVLTLEGVPVYFQSRKGTSRGDIVRILSEFGDPVIVAADVSPLPEFVKKLANEFEAISYFPEKLLTTSEKQEITREYLNRFGVEIGDFHSRDALVAAIKAFNHYKSKLESTENELETRNVPVSTDEAKALVIKGYSIQRAFESLLPHANENSEILLRTQMKEEPLSDSGLKIQGLKETVLFHKKRVEEVIEANQRLTSEVDMLRKKLTNMQEALRTERSSEMKEIRKEREIEVQRREIEALRRELEIAREKDGEITSRSVGDNSQRDIETSTVMLKPIDTFTKTGLMKAFSLLEIRSGDIVLLLDSSGGGASTAEELAKRGIRAVVSQTAMAHQALDVLERNGIPVIRNEELDISWRDGLPYAERTDLLQAIDSVKNKGKVEAEKNLIDIIEDYRNQRRLKHT
jgi:predicted RNase H-like nuclease (RuvC/YqgF family)